MQVRNWWHMQAVRLLQKSSSCYKVENERVSEWENKRKRENDNVIKICCELSIYHARKEGFLGGSDVMRSIDGKNVYVYRPNGNGMGFGVFGYLI